MMIMMMMLLTKKKISKNKQLNENINKKIEFILHFLRVHIVHTDGLLSN